MHLKSFFRRIISKTSSSVSGFKSLCLQAGQAILNNAGNLMKAGESLCKWSTVKNMGKSMVLACVLPIPPEGQMDFAEHLQSQVLEKIDTIGVDVLFGEKLENAVKSNLRAFGSDLIGVEISKRIGKAYKENKIPGVVHKLSHALSGALQGWIQGDVWSGAFGAFIAETFMDLFSPEQGPLSMKSTIEEMERQKGDKLTREEFLQVYNAELKNYANACKTSARELAYSRMTTAVTSMLIGLNPEVSEHTGGIALENNTWGVVLSGISICFGGYEIYQLKCVYDEDGVPGVLEKLGIDKIENIGTKTIFKIGERWFGSVSKAINYAISKIPGGEIFLGSMKDKIIRAAEKIYEKTEKISENITLKIPRYQPNNLVMVNNVNLSKIPVQSKKTLVGTGGSGGIGKEEIKKTLKNDISPKTPITPTPKTPTKTSVPGEKKGIEVNKNRSVEKTVEKNEINKGVKEYDVGSYDDLKKRSIPGDDLDIHHVPQKHPAKLAIKDYQEKKGSSIVLSEFEHRKIPNVKGKYNGSSRDLLANDIRNLRNFTEKPNKKIVELMNLAKKQNPKAYVKPTNK